ncbi:MAG TPA: cell envelope integrity protein TolA [Dokdonella sp.]|uniref:cell envelope integrity protein TolA n=1 Tax=Dokdonella sp. TaxID=2291710 RepID=UPI002D7E29FE|nr:cell envelope integrity protein TolA [Dokdonella sp.]HET9032719.1 cell envelope integrity protein TolA [Dokdonella sp.]
MKESLADKARAVLYSLLLHGLLIGLIALGLLWTTQSRTVVMPGPVIEASLVGPTSAPKPASSKPRAKPSRPKPVPPPAKAEPEKPKPDTVPPPEPPKQDLIEQQQIAAIAAQKAEEAKKEQEEKRRREQILLEQEKQEAARAKELAEVRKQLADAQKRKNLEKERLKQLQDKRLADQQQAERQRMDELLDQESKQAQTGAGGQDNDLEARYAAAIQAAVTQNWNRPESIPPGLRCTLLIVQIPGGDVISARVTSPCNADAAARMSIEQAVMRAAPLPYRGYEKVFSREITFNFKYDGQG